MEYPWKNDNIHLCFSDCQFDILVTTKNNIAWHRILATHRLHERTQGWRESCHINTAYNTNDPNANPYQPGRVAILSLNKSAHQVFSGRLDLGKLGRFCWTTYCSKNNCTLHIIAQYQLSSSNNGHLSVTQQHWWAFKGDAEKNNHPCIQFWNELWPLLASWIELGNQILIAMDVNKDVQLPNVQSFFQSFGMTKAIVNRHGPDHWHITKGQNP